MDPVSKLAEAIAGVAMPGGGFVVALLGALGGAAATNTTEVSSTSDPNCPPGSIDLSCFPSTVSEGSESVLGSGVPGSWLALETVPAGAIASVAALVVVLLVAVLIAANRN